MEDYSVAEVRRWFDAGVSIKDIIVIAGADKVDKAIRGWIAENAQKSSASGAGCGTGKRQAQRHIGIKPKILKHLTTGPCTRQELAACLDLPERSMRWAIYHYIKGGYAVEDRDGYLRATRKGEEYAALVGNRTALRGFDK